MQYLSLDRGWRTVVCAAPGPSLSREQCALAMQAQRDGRCRIVVVNGAWEWLPTADVLYAADDRWWTVHVKRVLDSGFAGEFWTHDDIAAARHRSDRRRLQVVRSVFGNGLPREPDRIARGGPSGHHAIALSARFGALHIPLIGHDCQNTGKRTHCHGNHAQPLTNGDPSTWLPHFAPLAADLAAAGVDVANCTPHTALDCFRRSTLEHELATVNV